MTTASETGLPFNEIYEPPAYAANGALVASMAQYRELYDRSMSDPDGFWREMADKYINWISPYGKVHEEDLSKGHIAWFLDGKLNVSANCLDRHLESRGEKTAILWEGDEPGDNRRISYRDLHEKVCKLANALKSRGP